MLGIGGWVAAIGYVSVHYGAALSWLVALAPLVALIVKGKLWPSQEPAAERRAERDRRIRELDDEIERLGGHEATEKSPEAQQAIQGALQLQIALYDQYSDNGRAPRQVAPPRSLSRPRRVLRSISKGLILLIMIPLAVVFYGSLLLAPPMFVYGAASLVMGKWSALALGVLTLPLSGWFVWWWIRRASPSTVSAAGAGMAIGAGFGGGGGS